jgi:hypothetical protein
MPSVRLDMRTIPRLRGVRREQRRSGRPGTHIPRRRGQRLARPDLIAGRAAHRIPSRDGRRWEARHRLRRRRRRRDARRFRDRLRIGETRNRLPRRDGVADAQSQKAAELDLARGSEHPAAAGVRFGARRLHDRGDRLVGSGRAGGIRDPPRIRLQGAGDDLLGHGPANRAVRPADAASRLRPRPGSHSLPATSAGVEAPPAVGEPVRRDVVLVLDCGRSVTCRRR